MTVQLVYRWCVGSAHDSSLVRCEPMWSDAVVIQLYRYYAPVILIYLFIYLFAQAHTSCTMRQGLEKDSKAQTCTDSYPKITENPTQYQQLPTNTIYRQQNLQCTVQMTSKIMN